MKIMKQIYEKPEMAVTEVGWQSILCASGGDGDDDGQITFPIPGDDDEPWTGGFE